MSDQSCPSCGARMALGGSFCKHCGFDRQVAASEDAHLDGVDLPQGYAAEEPYEDPRRAPVKAGKKEWTVVLGVFLGLIALSILYGWMNRGR